MQTCKYIQRNLGLRYHMKVYGKGDIYQTIHRSCGNSFSEGLGFTSQSWGSPE